MTDTTAGMASRLKTPMILFLIFWGIAIFFWQLTGNVFLLFNFGYIGTSLALGIGAYGLLPRKNKPAGRRFAQFLVGVYMLGFLGFIKYENMQIEGFFIYLLAGFFSGSVIHYMVAKVFLPLVFGRGWCGWGCWTAMVLDYLPYKENNAGRLSAKWEKLRYVHFALSLCLVLILWFYFDFRPQENGHMQVMMLVAGNLLYYSVGIIMAFV